MKITLDSIVSGFKSVTKLITNFDKIEDDLNNKVLYRDNPEGEPNYMQNDLDMNSYNIINQGNPVEVSGFNWLGDWSSLTTYAVGDAVHSNGTAYIAIAASTNQTPPNGTYWQIVAEANYPTQAGNADKALTTDGSAASWGSIHADHVDFTNSGTGGVERTLQAKLEDVVNVKDFGAVGDGVTDDTVAIQAALDASPHVRFPSGTYKINNSLTLNNNQVIQGEGSTIDASGLPTSVSLDDQTALIANGSAAATIAITSDVTEGDTTITVADSSSFVVGDYVVLRSTQWYMDGVSSGTSLRGWVGQVSAIPTGTTVEVTREAPTSLASASTATISKVTKKTVEINDLTITCGGVGEGHAGIRLFYNVGSTVNNVNIDATEDVGVRVKTSTDVAIKGGSITNCTSSATLGNTGYGVVFLDGTTLSSVKNTYFNKCRHSVSGGGILPTWNIDVVGCSSENAGLSSRDYDCHEPCFYWRFLNNTSLAGADGSGGFVIRGQHTRIEGNTIRADGDAVRVKSFIANTDGITGTVISNNTILAGTVSLEGSSSDGYLYKTRCLGNVIRSSNFGAITVLGCHTLTISGGFIEGAGTKSIDVSSSTFSDMSEIHISDVVFGSSTEELVEADFVDGLTLSNLVGTVSMASVFEINNSRRVQVRGCRAITTETFLVISDTDEIAIDSCRADIQTGGAAWDFVRLAGTTSNTQAYIRNCQAFGVYRKGVYTTNYDTIIVTGCDFIDATNAIPIDLAGASTTVNANNLT